jgi:speckle-type POZ protein
MSSAIAAAGKPSLSASTIVAASTSGCHILKIEGYSRTKGIPTGQVLFSSQFAVGGHRWRICYYPNGDESDTADYISVYLFFSDYISVYLMLDEDVTEDVKAQFKIYFAKLVEKQPSWTSRTVRNFPSQEMRGYRKFIEREYFEKSEHLKDDSFTIKCDVAVVRDICTKEITAPKFVSVPPPELNQHLCDLLKTEKGADVVFEVGGETIAAHRCVLASRSSVFNAELFGFMKEGDTAGVVRIDDMEVQVFKALLYFAYTDSLLETKKEEEDIMCQHLLVAADRYNMQRLKLICEEKLCEYIDVGTVAIILALAEQHHCDGLKKACFNFLSCPAHRRAFVATNGFQHLYKSCPSLVTELIAMPSPS